MWLPLIIHAICIQLQVTWELSVYFIMLARTVRSQEIFMLMFRRELEHHHLFIFLQIADRSIDLKAFFTMEVFVFYLQSAYRTEPHKSVTDASWSL